MAITMVQGLFWIYIAQHVNIEQRRARLRKLRGTAAGGWGRRVFNIEGCVGGDGVVRVRVG
jgi:hypothetical protein